MARKLLACAITLLLGVSLTGCWVLDELDHGAELVDKYGGAMNEKGPSKPAKDAAEVTAPEPKSDAVADYFRKENEAGTTRTISPGQVSEGIVKCKLGTSTQFMTKDACAARGGLEGA